MRLISSQADYYDHYARDRSLSDQTYVWERRPQVVVAQFSMPSPVWMQNCYRGVVIGKGKHQIDEIIAYGFLVFFCGRVIPMAKVYRSNVSGSQESYIFSFDDLPEELVPKEEKTRKWKLAAYKNRYSPAARMLALFELGSKPWMSAQFSDPVTPASRAQLPKMDLCDMHRVVGSPVFCHAAGVPEALGKHADYGWRSNTYARESRVIIHPLMSALWLHKVLDAFVVFQDIERFLTNELAPRDVKRDKSIKDNPVPDKIKAESHGFDKWSFRKEPKKKK